MPHLEFIKCNTSHYDAVTAMYERAVRKLEQTVNYPKWSDEHPSREYVAEAIEHGEQFACVNDGEILGAVVLSENPEGMYELGNWKTNLRRGEYIAVHVLAVDPQHEGEGIGKYMTDSIITYARDNGYKAVRLDVLPENIPAINLYKSRGFTSAGKSDLRRNIPGIDMFELYELNLL